MGKLARKAAEEQFTRERFIDEYERVYRRLVKDPTLMQSKDGLEVESGGWPS
jgi:hypothetical protein